MTPEGLVKKEIKKTLTKQGVFYFMPVSNGMGKGGVSDFICCVPTKITPNMVGDTLGVFTAIEAKAPGGKPTARQEAFLADVFNHGGNASVCDDATQLDLDLHQ